MKKVQKKESSEKRCILPVEVEDCLNGVSFLARWK